MEERGFITFFTLEFLSFCKIFQRIFAFFRFVFPCRQWIPLTSNKGDGVKLECKTSEKSRLATIRGT